MKVPNIIMDPISETFDETLSVFGTGRKANRSTAVSSLTFQDVSFGGSVGII
jgi:hypothetical protein